MVYVIDGDDALSEAERRAAWAEAKVADADAAAADAATADAAADAAAARVAAARVADAAWREKSAAARTLPQTQVRVKGKGKGTQGTPKLAAKGGPALAATQQGHAPPSRNATDDNRDDNATQARASSSGAFRCWSPAARPPLAVAADPIMEAPGRATEEVEALQRWRDSMAYSRGLEPWWLG